MITCKKCGEDKEPTAMCKRAGKPSQLCKACYSAALAKARAAAGTASAAPRKYTKRKTAAAGPTGALGRPLVLEISAGYGLRAVIHDGYLQIKQEDAKGNADVIMLSKAEAKSLFEEFEEWTSC